MFYPLVGPVSVTSALLVHEMTKRTILEALNAEKPTVSRDAWDFILKNPESEFVVPLTKCLFYKITNQLTYDPYDVDDFRKTMSSSFKRQTIRLPLNQYTRLFITRQPLMMLVA